MPDIKNRIKKFKILDSTHLYLKDKYKEFENGSIIIADTQSAGIGTKGHAWYTGNDNLAMSILYKPTCKFSELDGLTIEIAKVVQSIIKQDYKLELEIKVPNDLIANNKKIAGILTESNIMGDKINYLIISLGINLNECNFPEELNNIATSIKLEKNIDVDRDKFILRVVEELEKRVWFLSKNNFKEQ